MGNALVPELAVRNCAASIVFYRDLLGFEVAYERPEEGFACLRLGKAKLMIDQIGFGRTFAPDDAPLDYPLGRGVNLQIAVASIAPLLRRIQTASISSICRRKGAGIAPAVMKAGIINSLYPTRMATFCDSSRISAPGPLRRAERGRYLNPA